MLSRAALYFSLSTFFLGIPPAFGQVTALSFRPVDAAYSSQLDKAIFVSASPNQLHIYDPAANADQTVALPSAPQNVSLAPDGTHAAVAFSNSIVYVDLKAKSISNTFANVAVGSGTLVCGSGYIYVFNQSAISINIVTGFSTTSNDDYYSSSTFDPALNAVYASTSGESPASIGRYDASNGVLGNITEQQFTYFALFNVCGPLLVSPDGATIYSACGAVYSASSDPTKDMRYLGTLPGGTHYQSMFLSGVLKQVAAIPLVQQYSYPAAPNADTVVNLYTSDSLNPFGQFATTPFTVNSNTFPAHGRWVFYNSKSSSMFIVTQADSAAGLELDYAMETVDLTKANSCNATFGSTTASATAPGSFLTTAIKSGEHCTFTAVSNVPWIELASGYYGSGNTTLTYLVRPNLSATARTGSISMGSQTLSVTQDAAGQAASLVPLSFKPVAADYDKALDRIVMASSSPNELHIYDPVSQLDQVVPLSYAPLAVSVRPDGLFAAVGHDGHISIVNLQALTVTTMAVDSINAGIALPGNGYVYTFPIQTSSWAEIDSIQLSSGTISQISDIYDGDIPRLDASGNYLYVSSYEGASKLNISTGPASIVNEFLGTLDGNIWLSEDGNRLINSSGQVFFTSTVPSKDLQPDGQLSGINSVDWVADSEIQKQIAILTDPSSSANAQLQIYAENGLTLQREEGMPGFSNNGNSYISHGKYLFWNSAASKLFALTEADSTSGLLSDFAVYTVAMPESVPACSYAVSPSLINVPPAYSGNWTVNVTTNCEWSAVTASGSFLHFQSYVSTPVGNGQFSFSANTNQGAARSSSISVGNQTITVNQAASTCSYTLSASSITLPLAGGPFSVNLTTQTGCPWSVESQSAWLSVTSSQAGAGPAVIQFLAAPTSTAQFDGFLNIAGNSFTVQETIPAPTQAATSVFVVGQPSGSVRNNYSGFVGFEFKVGSSAIQVTNLGRWVVPGNSGTHLLKLVQADGTDVPGGSALLTINVTSRQYLFAALGNPVTLSANTTYYMVSSETSGGDQWYDIGSFSSVSAGSILAPAYSYSGTYVAVPGLAGDTYGPVNFLFSTPDSAPNGGVPSGTSFVTAQTPGSLRNNYSGAVGYSFTVTQAITVTALGRYVAPGNSGSHLLQLVSVDQSGKVTPVASGSVSLATAASGQFDYVTLSSSVTLQPNVTYYLTSQETAGGDSWYDIGSISSGTGNVLDPVYTYAGQYDTVAGLPGEGYGPLSFLYGSVTTPATPAALITGQTAGVLRNNYSGFIGTTLQVGTTALSVTSLGRFDVAGNSGTHTVKLVQANGTDVPGGSVTIKMAGGTAGQYAYAALPAPVMLQANTTYFLVSQEVSGGDSWYSLEPITATSAAQILDAVYTDATGNYVSVYGLAGYSYGPLNLLYH